MKRSNRTIYISQYDATFDVCFNVKRGDVPIFKLTNAGIRQYHRVSPASIQRLNALVFLESLKLNITAHLFPFISLWVSFPPKGK